MIVLGCCFLLMADEAANAINQSEGIPKEDKVVSPSKLL